MELVNVVPGMKYQPESSERYNAVNSLLRNAGWDSPEKIPPQPQNAAQKLFMLNS